MNDIATVSTGAAAAATGTAATAGITQGGHRGKVLLDAVIRDATPEDAGHLTQVVNLASEGLALAMWTDIAGPGGDPWEIGRQRALRDEGAFSWRNARVCERNVTFAGALIGYPLGAEPDTIDADTPEVFHPLIELENRVPGTFYINVLATLEAHRRVSVAQYLIEDAARRAAGLDLSLIVASGNHIARAAYAASGFSDVATAGARGGFGWTPGFAEWVLMRRPA